MTVLGCIKGGAKTFGSIKTRSGLKSEQLEQILSILDKSELIQTDEAKGLLGQPKPIMTITDKGTKQVEEYISQLNKKWKELVALAIAGEREKLDEIIKWHILIEGTNNPVTIRRHFAVVIVVDTVRICETHQVQPVPGHMLTILRLLHKSVDEVVPGIG